MSGSGRLVLVFDDGYAEDHEEVRPVLESLDAPAVFAVVPEWIGEPGYLDGADLEDLRELGCEVAAHGRRHRYLQSHGLSRDAAVGDRQLILDSEHLFPGTEAGVVAGDRMEVLDGETREVVEVAETMDDGGESVVRLAAPLESRFDGGESVLRPTRPKLVDEIVGARDSLEASGFDPSTFVFPYDVADVRAWQLAREAYDVVANAAVRSLPNPPGTDRRNLRRWYLETDKLTDPGLEAYLDAVAERGGIGVLAGHSAWETVTSERIVGTVRAARERRIEVTTFEWL